MLISQSAGSKPKRRKMSFCSLLGRLPCFIADTLSIVIYCLQAPIELWAKTPKGGRNLKIYASVMLDSREKMEDFLSLGWETASTGWIQLADGEQVGMKYTVIWRQNCQPPYPRSTRQEAPQP